MVKSRRPAVSSSHSGNPPPSPLEQGNPQGAVRHHMARLPPLPVSGQAFDAPITTPVQQLAANIASLPALWQPRRPGTKTPRTAKKR